MSVLDPPRHPVVIRALDHARRWCDGHIIDEAPAFTHAVLVARSLVDYLPGSRAELVAAALLHDSPEFAPPQLDLETALNLDVGENVFPLVAALHAEHEAMAPEHEPDLSDPDVLLLAAVDRIVAFRSLIERADRCGDPQAFFARREPLRRLIPYFHRWSQAAAPQLPDPILIDLCRALDGVCNAINAARER